MHFVFILFNVTTFESFLKIPQCIMIGDVLVNAITCKRLNQVMDSRRIRCSFVELINDAQRSAFPPKSIIRPRA